MKNYVLSEDEVTFFNEHGYLRLDAVFSPAEVDVMAEELDWQIDNWAGTGPGWRGEWRKVYMDVDTERRSKLTALHDLHRVILRVVQDLDLGGGGGIVSTRRRARHGG